MRTGESSFCSSAAFSFIVEGAEEEKRRRVFAAVGSLLFFLLRALVALPPLSPASAALKDNRILIHLFKRDKDLLSEGFSGKKF
jgi:hypothetical protein